jgi:hypothetical protein
VEDFRRSQQTDEMPKEQQQDTDVKQIAGPAHVLVAEHLTGMGFPGKRVAIEARQTAEQEYRASQIRINAE